MSKHIIDGPRKRAEGDRLEPYTKIDKTVSGKPGEQSEKLMREARKRDSGEKLRRFAEIDRRDD